MSKKVKNYFIGVYIEILRIRWPTKKQWLIYTLTVLIFATIIALFLLFDDWIISIILKALGFYKDETIGETYG